MAGIQCDLRGCRVLAAAIVLTIAQPSAARADEHPADDEARAGDDRAQQPAPEPTPADDEPAPDLDDGALANGAPSYETVVLATRGPRRVRDVPVAVTIIDGNRGFAATPTVGLDEALVGTPGLFAQNRFNFAQDLRLSIRGFGARSAFGVRGIQIRVDGLPVTFADGQSELDSVDPAAIERIEIVRGAAGSLYGNGAGGVIQIATSSPPTAGRSAEATTVVGADGLFKVSASAGARVGSVGYVVALSRLDYDGYRERSATTSTSINGKLELDLSATSRAVVVVNVVESPRAQDPGGLTFDELAADPRQSAPNNAMFRTGEQVSQSRVGATYEARRREESVTASAYYTARRFRGAIPFRVVELARSFTGGSLQLTSDRALGPMANRVTAGIDTSYQDDARRNSDNVDGRPGDTALLIQDERVVSAGPFVQDELAVVDDLVLLAGARYDFIRFSLRDRLDSDGDDSGDETFSKVTGRAGAVFAPASWLAAYASWAQTFDVPTTTELVNRPDGGSGINPELSPQRADTVELGVRGDVGDRARYQLTGYAIWLRDELVRFEDDTGRAFFRNAGRSRRLGAEAGVELSLAPGLALSVALDLIDAELVRFNKDGVELGGNDVPGIASLRAGAQLRYRTAMGLWTTLELSRVGPMYADDENAVSVDGATVINVRGGYELERGTWVFAPFVGAQNLLNQDYAANVRINAFGGRYYEPGPSITVYGGLTIRHAATSD